MRLLDRLWVVSSVDAVATATWHRTPRAGELRADYLAALNKLQPWTLLQWQPERPAVSFDNPRATADFVRRAAWSTADVASLVHLYAPSEHARLRLLIDDAFALIAETSEDLWQLIELTIGEVLLALRPGFGGGSVSSAVGLIWLSPQGSTGEWTRLTTAENIVHEWVHNMLFLADMVDPVFAVSYLSLAQESSHVTSAILHRRRSFDRSYHSAAVAAALVFFRTLTGDAANADKLVSPALRTVGELKRRRQLLTASGVDILTEVEAFLRNRDCDRMLDLLAGRTGSPSRVGALG